MQTMLWGTRHCTLYKLYMYAALSFCIVSFVPVYSEILVPYQYKAIVLPEFDHHARYENAACTA